MTTVVSLVVVLAALGVTVLALLGRADAQDREQEAVAQEQAALERSQAPDPTAGLLGTPSLSDRESELRAYFRHDVLSAVNLVDTAIFSAACEDGITGQDRTPQEILDEVASSTDRPELVALPDDEWRALLSTDGLAEEQASCARGF